MEHALPSLAFGLAMGLATTVHHLHAALAMRSTGPGLHVVWTEAVLMPVTVASMALCAARSTWRLVRGAGVRCTSCPSHCTGSPPGTP